MNIATKPRLKPRMSKRERQNIMYGLFFAAPIILGFLIFTLGPMLASLYFSLTNFEVTNDYHWVGLQNYKDLFMGDNPYFYKSLKVTLYYVGLSVPIHIIYAFIMALFLNSMFIKKRHLSIFRTVFYLPSIVPIVASSMIWMWIFNPDFGLLNALLRVVGLPKLKWIYDAKTVIPSLVIMGLWTTSQVMIIFLAGLQDISVQLYEAVDLDGGNFFHKLRYVTIPMMTPTIFFNLIIGVINAFQTFAQAYIMTDGGPNNASLFYAFYLFRTAFRDQHMSVACALAWVLFVIIALFTFLIFKSQKKWVIYDR